jgi:hypothetical protein
VIWLLSGLLAAQAPSPSPRVPDTIALLEIDPAPAIELTAGRETRIRARVEYLLQSTDKAAIMLALQDQSGQNLTGKTAQVKRAVKRGRDTVTLEDCVIVPAQAQFLEVFIALTYRPKTLTTAVARVRYPVKPSTVASLAEEGPPVPGPR